MICNIIVLLQITYNNTSPYMLMSEQSVGDLNTRLRNPVTIYNFRPNIIVNTDKPYAEVYIQICYSADILNGALSGTVAQIFW